MAIDLRKNKDSLIQAYEKVFNEKDDTDWALFGYEGQSSVLKVVGTGDGGIEEMADDLSSGKMLYGYCRVLDPNTKLFKYVLVHWTGESVPENVKLKYTSHLRDVQAFLKSIHVTVPARCEEDVDLEDILKKVAKSSGSNYSFHKEKAKPEEAPAPVGTDYKRIIPTREIKISDRDQFWAEAEKDEIKRQNSEKARMEQDRKQAEQERVEREKVEAKNREKRMSDHMRNVHSQREAEKRSEQQNREAEKKRWEQIQKESSMDEEERGHRSDQMRKERVHEASNLVSSSASSARDFFKQKSVERPDAPQRGAPPPRKLQHKFGNQQESREEAPPARKQPIQLPREEPPPAKPVRQPERQPEPEPEPEPYYAEEPEPQYAQEPEPQYTHEPEPRYAEEPEPQYTHEPEPEPAAIPTSPRAQEFLKQALPPRQDSDGEEDDQDWDEPPAEHFEFREKRVPSYHEDYSAEQHHAETQSHRVSSTQHYDETEEDQQESVPSQEVFTADQGQCARALYDYQAADDTEITFDPDDVITNIEQIDSGWWQGFGPDGKYGMFPANYVELLN